MEKLTRIQFFVMLHKFISHLAQDLHTIWPGQASLIHQIQPILLKQFRADHIEKIVNLIVLAVRGCS